MRGTVTEVPLDGLDLAEKVTLTATSAAGQTATKDVNVVVYSAIGFNSVPGADGIIAFVK